MRVYIITKLHKPGTLCLSVVNSINYYTAYISKYIDYNLHFVVKQMSSFIDTSSLMNKMSQSLKQNKSSGVSRTLAALEIDFFVIIVYSYKPVTTFIENSALDDLGLLDPPLITSSLLMTSNKLIFCRVSTYKIIPLENGCKFETSRENLSLYQKSLSSTFQFAYIYICQRLLEATKRDWVPDNCQLYYLLFKKYIKVRIKMKIEHETTFEIS